MIQNCNRFALDGAKLYYVKMQGEKKKLKCLEKYISEKNACNYVLTLRHLKVKQVVTAPFYSTPYIFVVLSVTHYFKLQSVT